MIEEVIPELHMPIFSIIDIKCGFWQVALDKASSLLTAFNTPYGRFCFSRMPFGLNVAGDAFQQKLDEVFAGLEGVTGIANDIFIFGRTEEEHDRNLINFLNRAREHGLKRGAEKTQCKKTSVEFCGLHFTTDGHKPTNKKIQDVQMMPQTKDLKQLQSLLGMVNYLNSYSPRLVEITAPLWDLTKDNVSFLWGLEHTEAFHITKQEIQHAPLLAYYDPSKPTVLQMDMSGYGIGSCLLQNGKPVAHASKAVSNMNKDMSL